MTTKNRFAPAVAALSLVVAAAGCGADTEAGSDRDGSGSGTVTVTDDFDREVEVPVAPERVAVMEWEGLVTKTLAVLDADATLVAVDPATKDDPTRQVIVDGIADAVDVGSAWSGINYEQLAAQDPEVVFLEAYVSSEEDRELHDEAVETIEGLDIPVVVFLSPSSQDEPDLQSAYDVIDLVGTVYDREDDTDRVVEGMKAGVDRVLERLPDDGDAPRLAMFASTNYLMGRKSVQDAMFADLLGAENVAGEGTFLPVSEEQLLAADPDVLVVIGHEGYISAADVTSGKQVGIDWSKVRDLGAIREDRMTTLGYDEWRATLETPIALMKVAKVLYPDEFADVDVEAEQLAYYEEVFDLDEAEAREAIEGQQFRADLSS